MNIQEQIIKKFIKLEEENNLYSLKINGVAFYELVRMGIYYHILEKKKIYSKQPEKNYKNIIKIIFLIIKSIFSRKKKLLENKIAVIPHSRLFKNLDIYTFFFKEILKDYTYLHQSVGKNFEIAENAINIDFLVFMKKIKFFFLIFSLKNNKQIIKIANLFKKEFNLNNNFNTFLHNLVKNKLLGVGESLKFLEKSKFKHLFVVNAYGNNHIIYAANKLGIKTIELQHGVINKNHLGYNFSKKINFKLYSFPEKILLFGEKWKKNANFPINDKNIFSLGFPYFDEQMKRVTIKKNKNILILSQITIREYLLEFIRQILIKNNQIFFTYKPHPKEDISIAYAFFKKNDLLKNIDIACNTKNIYDLFNEHEMQIGVFSTSIYEGYACGMKTGIIKAPGWESMNLLFDCPNFYIIENNKDLDIFINAKLKKTDNSFFKKNAIQNYDKFLNEIIK